jgi:hypothetical protein
MICFTGVCGGAWSQYWTHRRLEVHARRRTEELREAYAEASSHPVFLAQYPRYKTINVAVCPAFLGHNEHTLWLRKSTPFGSEIILLLFYFLLLFIGKVQRS